MPAPRPEPPALWIIAGPNGSGKSTLYGSKRDNIYGNTEILDVARPFWIINPDLLASRIRAVERLGVNAANLEAVKRIGKWLEASVRAHQSVGVETVLSTDKYRRLVRAAKQHGFEVRLIYVVLRDPELNVKRVRLRVKKGGHDVPVKKIKERWTKSLRQLPWFLREADWALIFDNTGKLRPVGRKEEGTIFLDPDAPPVIRKAVAKIGLVSDA
jgi:predicted ABC-type ATPase